jgi:nitrous oxidase accessory protein NosD
MRVKMTFAVLAMATLALALPASSTAHRTVTVHSGESIKAAIDNARENTTIKIEAGTYAESLKINKDGIKLIGAGRKLTKIVAPATTPGEGEGCVDRSTDPPTVIGICVFDLETDGTPISTVEDVEISHLSVTGFNGSGILFIHTRDGEVTRTIASNNAEYGIFANDSSGTVIERNVTGFESDDPEATRPEAGIYVGDSPHADATVWKNVSYGNTFGFFIRDAAHGDLVSNKAFSNCAGVVFLNTDETNVPPDQTPGTPVDVEDWVARDNLSAANNEVCASEGDEPPFSGYGIIVLAGNDIGILGNEVYGNSATATPDGPPPGGIVVVGDPTFKSSTNIKVGFNTALGNGPFDLFWDEQGSAKFFANDCLTSQPDGLCDDSQLGGDGHHGDDGDHHGGDRDHSNHKKHKGSKHSKHKKHSKRHH